MLGVGRDGPVGPQLVPGGDPPSTSPDRATSSVTSSVTNRSRPSSAAAEPRSHERRVHHDAETDAWAILASVEGLGPVGLVVLVTAYDDAQSVLAAASRPGGAASVVAAMGARAGRGLSEGIVAAVRDRHRILASIRDAGLTVLTLDDLRYPPLLAGIELPAPVLFVRGSLADLAGERSVAVVGTRRPTDAGRTVAARIAGSLARTGAVVVSGLATGIDGVAHAATVGVGGRTIAVIGGGHERAVLRQHASLAERIVASGGAVVSEHAPATRPSRGTFPRRNRIISGLAEATVVVEAGLRSGALITAGWALEQGRECFVVPGALDAPMSAGCLGLLREYPGEVRVVATVGGLIEDLGLVADVGRVPAGTAGSRGPVSSVAGPGPAAILAGLPGPVAAAARSLAGGSRATDHVVAATGLSVPGALAALTMLEDLGLAVAAYGRYRLAGPLSDLA